MISAQSATWIWKALVRAEVTAEPLYGGHLVVGSACLLPLSLRDLTGITEKLSATTPLQQPGLSQSMCELGT